MTATTLDPSSIVNFSGVGSLSNGNLTFSSTGISFVLSTRSAKGKQTLQADGAISIRNGINGSGFAFSFNGSNWEIQNGSGTVIVTGPSTPVPSNGGIITIDCDVPNSRVSMRYNGTSVFSNADVSGVGLTSWYIQAFASSSGTMTVGFSGLTYPPLGGYVEFDSHPTALAVAGEVNVVGQAGYLFASNHKSAMAEAGQVSVSGSAGAVVATANVFARAQAGQINIVGQAAFASTMKVVNAVAGQARIVGFAPVVTLDMFALATAGSIEVRGQAARATINLISKAQAGVIAAVGATPFVGVDHPTFAIAGHIEVVGYQPRAFVLMAVVPAGQSVTVQPENRTFLMPKERRTALAAADGNSRIAQERRTAAA